MREGHPPDKIDPTEDQGCQRDVYFGDRVRLGGLHPERAHPETVTTQFQIL